MPRLIVTPTAAAGLDRCRRFLVERDVRAARRAAAEIKRRFEQVTAFPKSGRPVDDDGHLRELVIAFGDSGFVALYRYDETADAVIILAFRHQLEAGY